MPPAIVRRLFVIAVAALATVSLPAMAEPVSVADSRAIRSVVEAQLDAFASDDAQRAFSYAAPALREMMGSPDRFMAMVRGGYPVVYRPASVTFLGPVRLQGQMFQGVHFTDASGALFLATYRLERQPDNAWRISGCEVQPLAGKMT